jgi:hypothetical protein
MLLHHLETTMRLLQAIFIMAFAALLLACGGGGGGVALDTSGSVTNTPTNSPTVANLDGLAGAVPTLPLTISDSGGVSGASGDSGADGTAGEGERVAITFNFAALTGNWRIVESAYGIAGQTGTFSMVLDSAKGGYRYVGATTAQDNIFVSKAGVVTGSLPLRIKGVQRASKFVALLNSQLTSTLDGIVGTYNIGYTNQNPADVYGFTTVIGSLRIKTDGSFRICPFAAYSDTCANTQGVTVTTGTLQPSSTESNRFNVTVNGKIEGVASALNHSYGRTLIWDYVERNAANVITRTGSRIAAVQLVPAPSTAIYQGNWINTIRNANFAVSGTAIPGSDSSITLSLVASANNTSLINAQDPSAISGGLVTGCQTSTNAPITALPGAFGQLLEVSMPPSTITNTVDTTRIDIVSSGSLQSGLLLPIGVDSFAIFYASGGTTLRTYFNGVLQAPLSAYDDSPFYNYGFLRRLSTTPTFCR